MHAIDINLEDCIAHKLVYHSTYSGFEGKLNLALILYCIVCYTQSVEFQLYHTIHRPPTI